MRPGPATRTALLSRMVPNCRLPPGTEAHRRPRSEEHFCGNACRGSRLRLGNSALRSCLGGGSRRRPHARAPGSLDMNRKCPRQLTLERVAGNAELWPAALGNMLALWLGTLCRRCGRGATAKCGCVVQKVWRGESSCGRVRKKRPSVAVFSVPLSLSRRAVSSELPASGG
jgi:hypothetical protein